MGRVFCKMKFDRGMGIELPHSWNFANALYGFGEMGAEVIPYHSLDEVYDQVEREDIVLDYIEQCQEIFQKFGIHPYLPDYPEPLQPFLGRKIWSDTLNHIASDEKLWQAGYFVKPVKDKAFTGKIIQSLADLEGCGQENEDLAVLVSEPLELKQEWRCFIIYDQLVDVRPYQMGEGYLYHYDPQQLLKMLAAFRTWQDRPWACSMDIGVTGDGRTVLVECNDAYALGCYGLRALPYAKLISARWSQLLGVPDAYHFTC
ncbi:ATP-grasp domain-containing protein [Acidaminococcus sp. NSJ-142]|jgi:hypothetical protein|uniref:ATP-grasp domain-containing protein n=1 Tax=Acidaminococcus TaxID=904 RepID=UPI000CFA4A52|nr:MULTISPECIES: ATP-grasp domain-containing protein [Acidaminococcus]MCD2434560.1 ATP-grasp domain-containing protein [Acidaminococcus hominis]MCH4096950.1 ATP-grasp domain-containing protein [Acidaminococcus provencensis]